MNFSCLNEAIKLFEESEFGFTSFKKLAELYARLHFAGALENIPGKDIKRVGRLKNNILGIHSDTTNLLMLINRMEWTKKNIAKNEEVGKLWREYIQLDIDFWHINFKSLFDFVSKTISDFSDQMNVTPVKFTTLYRERAKYSRKIGPDFMSLLDKAEFYEFILSVRDELIHFGGESLVFGGSSDKIIFQVHKTAKAEFILKIKEFNFNKNNIINFENYAAYFMSNLIVFLNRFSEIVLTKLNLGDFPAKAVQSTQVGNKVLLEWIKSLNYISARTE